MNSRLKQKGRRLNEIDGQRERERERGRNREEKERGGEREKGVGSLRCGEKVVVGLEPRGTGMGSLWVVSHGTDFKEECE